MRWQRPKNTEISEKCDIVWKRADLVKLLPFALPNKGLATLFDLFYYKCRVFPMKWYLHWFLDNVTKVKETLNDKCVSFKL